MGMPLSVDWSPNGGQSGIDSATLCLCGVRYRGLIKVLPPQNRQSNPVLRGVLIPLWQSRRLGPEMGMVLSVDWSPNGGQSGIDSATLCLCGVRYRGLIKVLPPQNRQSNPVLRGVLIPLWQSRRLGPEMGMVLSVDWSPNGGQSGIRTHGKFNPTHDFESCALNRAQPSVLK